MGLRKRRGGLAPGLLRRQGLTKPLSTLLTLRRQERPSTQEDRELDLQDGRGCAEIAAAVAFICNRTAYPSQHEIRPED